MKLRYRNHGIGNDRMATYLALQLANITLHAMPCDTKTVCHNVTEAVSHPATVRQPVRRLMCGCPAFLYNSNDNVTVFRLVILQSSSLPTYSSEDRIVHVAPYSPPGMMSFVEFAPVRVLHFASFGKAAYHKTTTGQRTHVKMSQCCLVSMRHGVSHIRLGAQGGCTKEHDRILLVRQQKMWVIFESDGMAGGMYMRSSPPGSRRRNKVGASQSSSPCVFDMPPHGHFEY